MALFKYTYIFDLPGHGFTETHWRDGPAGETLLQAFEFARELGRRRQAMSGEQTILQAIRISNAEVAGRIGTTQIHSIPGVTGKGSAAPALALDVLVGTVNNEQTKTVYFRGFWDDEEITGGAPVKSAAFVQAFDSWRQYLVANSFGWHGVANAGQQFPVNSYTVSPQGMVSVVVKGNLTGVLPAVGYRSVRFSFVNGGRSQLNGVQVVALNAVTAGPPETSQVALKFPKALTAYEAGGLLTVQGKTFRDAENASIQRVGKRQAGAPLLRSPGHYGKRIRV